MKKECGLRLQRLILIHNDALKIGLDIILVYEIHLSTWHMDNFSMW